MGPSSDATVHYNTLFLYVEDDDQTVGLYDSGYYDLDGTRSASAVAFPKYFT